ncbi:putative membrane protein [Rhizobium phage Paso]|uniref:Putative membrane protein n=1 Tax=Rhizobium phage Paso TaxID=2767574 RepID=A0A7L8G5W7_9CAUD|nr:putative membrane protein [Rhizobium phage Paso]
METAIALFIISGLIAAVGYYLWFMYDTYKLIQGD